MAALAATVVAVRIPIILSSRHLDFDEGVYGASLLAMRDGALPFRDVFSSQGPLFLPVLWLFDLVGLRRFPAVRVGMALVAVAFVLGVYAIARLATAEGGRFPSVVAAAVVGTSSAGVAAAGPVHSDGPALALAVWALAAALGAGRLGRWRPVVVGVLLAAGFAVKSLFVLPTAVAVLWHYAARREWRHVRVAAGWGATFGLAVSLPWGLGRVWDQYVAFQIAAPRQRAWWTNTQNAFTLMWDRDIVFLLFAVVGLLVGGYRLLAGRTPSGRSDARRVVVVWLLGSLALVIFGTELNSGFYRFLVFVMTPAMVAFAVVRPSRNVVIATTVAAAVLALIPVGGAAGYLAVRSLDADEADVVSRLEALPAGALVIADEPGLAWMAGRHPPPYLVDTSLARIGSGYLNVDDVLVAAAGRDVCAVVFFSHRFDVLDPVLAEGLDGYRFAAGWDPGERLYLKEPCQPHVEPD